MRVRECVCLCTCVCVCVYSTAVPANLHSLPGLAVFPSLERLCSILVRTLFGAALSPAFSSPLYILRASVSSAQLCDSIFLHALSLDQWFLIRAAPFGHLTMSAEMPGLF